MEASNILHQVMTPHHTLEDVLGCSKRAQQPELQHDEEQQQKRPRSEPEQALRCPRCDSANTKFCYYNNYSLSQPRYFCKGCRRYWTQGGTLRNVPVGGGCRKNRRPSPSSSATSSQRAQDQQHSPLPTTNSSSSNNPLLTTRPITHSFPYDPTDLTLAFARLQQKQASVLHVADHDTCGFALPANTNPSGPSFLDILRGGFVESGYQNLFYGFGDGNIGGVDQEVVDQGAVFPFGEVGSGAAGTGTQESSKSGDEDDGKPMMGLQWQTGGGENINMLVDYGRDYWGNVGNPWHGLVNSSLM